MNWTGEKLMQISHHAFSSICKKERSPMISDHHTFITVLISAWRCYCNSAKNNLIHALGSPEVGDLFFFHLNFSFKPKLQLDVKVQFWTNAQTDFGFKTSLEPSFKPTFGLKQSLQLEFKQKIKSPSVFCDIKDAMWKQDAISTQELVSWPKAGTLTELSRQFMHNIWVTVQISWMRQTNTPRQ